MINGMTEQEFINDPDTVDFIIRKSAAFTKFVEEHPEILMTQLLQGKYWIGYVSRNYFELVINNFGSSFIGSASIVLGLVGRPALEQSGIIKLQQHPFLDLRGQGVLIGIIDTGIDYTKDVFIYEDGTSKVQFLYDQAAIGTPPEGFYVGVEYNNEQINQALKDEDPYSIVPVKDTSGHGTFLASIAAGRETDGFIGAAPDSDLIIVKLKKARPYYLDNAAVPPGQDNAFESSAVMSAIEYVLTKAAQLEKPVVICLGIGTNAGGHDGFGLFEEYLGSIASLRATCLCLSAGNESQARHHTQGKLTKMGQTQDIEIKVGDNAYTTIVSIWSDAPDRISVSVRSPTGELVERVPAKSNLRVTNSLIFEQSKVGIEYFFPLEEKGAQLTIVRLIDPTAGVWTITVHGDIILDGSYHAWLPLTGLVSPNIEFLSPNPYTTIVVPATMYEGITCGGYNSFTNSLYANSSWGPTRTPSMSPDLVAPAVNVSGYYPSGIGTMSGTSVAAAITSGASALMLQWGIIRGNEPAMSTYQIRAYLMRGCNRSDTMVYPNYQWGYGSLNLYQTFSLMREM